MNEVGICYLIVVFIKKACLVLLECIWIIIRYTVYYINVGVYHVLDKIFKLSDIKLDMSKRERKQQQRTVRHEFELPKSDEFSYLWNSINDVIIHLDLYDEDKEELFENLIDLITETERNAFQYSYKYMKNKQLNNEASYDDMVIEGIMQNKSENELRKKIKNPYKTDKRIELKNKRLEEYDDC